MTIWRKKRKVSGLSKTDMANELGLDFKYYMAIERGDVKMPSNLINKFNEIINRGKENEIKNVENNTKANDFWEKVKTVKDDGTYVLHDKLKEFNIPSMKELTRLLGYSSTGTIFNYLGGKYKAGDEFKKRLYNFFNDETNVQIPTEVKKKIVKKKNRKPRPVNKELDAYYKNTDFKKILKENQITNVQIANKIGVHNSTVSNMTSKKFKPSYNIIEQVKEYLDNILGNTISTRVEFPEIPNFAPAIEVKDLTNVNSSLNAPVGVIRRYTCELEEVNELLETYESKVKELQNRKQVCEEVLKALDEYNRIEA